MSWNRQKSQERVAKNDFNDFEVHVADLCRTMDFCNLGTKDVRRANAVHIYADVPNFHLAVEDAGGNKQEQRKVIRAASVLRRMQGELLDDQDVGRIQLQSARLHALCYKPYDDASKRATRSVVVAITLNSFLYDVFNKVFEDVRNFNGAIGIASGTSYIANIGFTGDRELICLGTPANLGAKVIDGHDTITITETEYDLLPDCLQEHFAKGPSIAGAVTFQAKGLRWSQHEDLAKKLEVDFDATKLKRRTEEARDALPLHEIEITEAETLINLDERSERNSKRTSAVAIFADLDGFTSYVQKAEDDNAIVSLIRTFHMIRREFQTVVETDYPGLVIQHQGDRTVALMHLPAGDELKKRCRKGLDVAIGLQSSMEHVLNERLSGRQNIHVAIGLDVGSVLVTRLGKKGERENICMGVKVTSAEKLQLRSSGQEIRISQTIYDTIESKTLKDQFAQKGSDFVARQLTFPRLDELEEEASARSDTLGAALGPNGIEVVTSSSHSNRPWISSKPWLSRA